MVTPITDFAYLQKLEQQFRDKFENQPPKLLGDIILPQHEVDKIGYTLGNCLRTSSQDKVEIYPLTISLFLTWSSIYYYTGVKFWDPIFEKLGLEKNTDDCSFLGEIFLDTIYSYGLQEPSDGSGNKYMTPILMHGYIGEHYAMPLLDYLNAVYSSYLEYDLSEEALAGLWIDLFNTDQEQTKLKNTVGKLREKELEIEKKMVDLQLSPSLDQNSGAQIENLEAEINRNKEDVVSVNTSTPM